MARFQGVQRQAATKIEAEQWLARMQALGPPEAQERPAAVQLADWLPRWLASIRPSVAPTTYGWYERCAAHLMHRIGHMALGDISADHVVECLDVLETDQGLGPHVRRSIRLVLLTALDWAVARGVITSNPARAVPPPKLPKSTVQTLTHEERAALIHAMEDAEEPLSALYALLAAHGPRISEALGCRIQDFDPAAGTLRIARRLHAENGTRPRERVYSFADLKSQAAYRTLRLAPSVTARLVRHLERQAEARVAAGSRWQGTEWGLLFATRTGGPMGYEGWPTKVLRAWVDLLGLPRVGLHDLRHTAATLAIADGIDAKVVSEMLGHASVSITLDRYTHPTARSHAEAAQVIERSMSLYRSPYEMDEMDGMDPGDPPEADESALRRMV